MTPSTLLQVHETWAYPQNTVLTTVATPARSSIVLPAGGVYTTCRVFSSVMYGTSITICVWSFEQLHNLGKLGLSFYRCINLSVSRDWEWNSSLCSWSARLNVIIHYLCRTSACATTWYAIYERANQLYMDDSFLVDSIRWQVVSWWTVSAGR